MTNSSFDESLLVAAERLLDEDRAAEAAERLKVLVTEGQGGVTARLLLARALDAVGALDEAIAVADETAKLHPTAETVLGRGAALLAGEKLPEAIAELLRAVQLDPESVEAHFLLGCAWLEAGEPEHALAALSPLPPDVIPAVTEKIAEAEAMRDQTRCTPGYVRHLFDQFSDDYDERMLGQLRYLGPQTLRELAQFVMPGLMHLAVLDLGCGTGLAGAAFKDRADRLVGLDLSPEMLERARARGVYDELFVGDLEQDHGHELYDLVLSADTLIYLGDLDTTFAVVAKALKFDGFFLFTTEAKDGEGFALGPKRRWCHSEGYLRELAARHGFVVVGFMNCVPRHDAHVPVNGFAVALQKIR